MDAALETAAPADTVLDADCDEATPTLPAPHSRGVGKIASATWGQEAAGWSSQRP
jgi:hypothetical protein